MKEPQPEKRGLTEIAKSFRSLLGIKATTADTMREEFKAQLPHTHDLLDAVLTFDVEKAQSLIDSWAIEAESFATKRKTLKVTSKVETRVSKLSDEERKVWLKALGVTA